MRGDPGAYLLTPCGDPFFSLGVNVLAAGTAAETALERQEGYHWSKYYPTLEAWSAATRARLQRWAFNTAGAWSLPPDALALPSVVDLGLSRERRIDWRTWGDPFAPETAERMHRAALAASAPYRGSPYRIGYFSDNEIGWWSGALFVAFTDRPPTNHTKRRLIALLHEHYRGDWAAFLRDFVPPDGVDSFDALLQVQHRRTHFRSGGDGMRVVRRWTGVVAEHYYRTAREAVRAADPDGLFFGDRLAGYYDPDAVRAMALFVDAIAVNYPFDTDKGWVAPYFFAGLFRLSGGTPVLVSEWYVAANENRSGNRNRTTYPPRSGAEINLTPFYTVVATQAERAQAAAAGAERLARQPGIIGLHWFMHEDEPPGGRFDGEDYNFGLVDVDDRPYEELAAMFARVNPALARAREGAVFAVPRTAEAVPRAAINPTDGSLSDWPLETTRIPMWAANDEVPFGDVHIAWSADGLFLAMIAMDHYDRELLGASPAPQGQEFRIDWEVDAGWGPRRFSIRVYPEPAPGIKDGYRLQAVLWDERRSGCEPPPPESFASHLRSVDGAPRVVIETRLAWSALGADGAQPPSDGLRMRVGVTAFHGARWFSSDGRRPAEESGLTVWPLIQSLH
jgi:hypothetical protein